MSPREAIIEINKYVGTEMKKVNSERLKQALRVAMDALRIMIENEDKNAEH